MAIRHASTLLLYPPAALSQQRSRDSFTIVGELNVGVMCVGYLSRIAVWSAWVVVILIYDMWKGKVGFSV